MKKRKEFMIRSILFVLCLLKLSSSIGQEASDLSDFFKRLSTVSELSGNLHYDTFPSFDFQEFKPSTSRLYANHVTFKVGFDSIKRARIIIFIENGEEIGSMDVHYFGSSKIAIFNRRENAIGKIIDRPIFYISKKSKFFILLNKGFKYGMKCGPRDLELVQILRADLFPVCVLTVRNSYIHMVEIVEYSSQQSSVIKGITAIVNFEPEKDKNLFVSKKSSFSEEFYVPKADFVADRSPNIECQGVPCWLHTSFY